MKQLKNYTHKVWSSLQRDNKIIGTQFVSTVRENKSEYSKRQIQGANRARELQERLGWPATAAFIKDINQRQILISTITEMDVKGSEDIYDKPIPISQGKIARNQPMHVPTLKTSLIPHSLAQKHPEETLDMDHFWVNGTPFLHTKSRNIKFVTSIKQITTMYNNQGFTI